MARDERYPDVSQVGAQAPWAAGAGTVYFNAYRLSGPCGTLTAENGVLEATDGRSWRLPAAVRGDDVTISGDGWTFRAAAGWVVREGARRGDYEAVRQRREWALKRSIE